MQKRVAILFSCFIFSMGLLFVHLFCLMSDESLQAAAIQQTTKRLELGSTRGNIYDCRGEKLVNTVGERVVVFKPTKAAETALSACILPEAVKGIFENPKKSPLYAIPTADTLYTPDAKTVQLVSRYAETPCAPHIIGYINGEKMGVCGLEKAYDSLLRTCGGTCYARCFTDAKGRPLQNTPLFIENQHYTSPAGIRVTLDKRIQTIAEETLEQYGVEKGAIVVLDVATSKILAMASVPTFSQREPELSLQAPNAPFLNRAITAYSVGSVFKPVVAAAALEQGIDESFAHVCKGFETVGNTAFHCHRRQGHGLQTMFDAMANSCNPYFIKLFAATGRETVCAMAENLGLGSVIELADNFYAPGGSMPMAEEVESPEDAANLSFGQGPLLASPLQMAALYATFANAGVYRAPSLMEAIVGDDGTDDMRAFLPVPRRAMSKQTAERVADVLLYTVEHGSCHRAKPEHMQVCGKSGTAQSGSYQPNGEEICHSWFCGWFPYAQPRYAVAVLKENGAGGSLDCAPIFKTLAEKISTLS